jgi:adenylate cyclase
MRAYAAQGRHGMALQQYRSCRELLREELQVDPEADTVALFEEIRRRRSTGNGTHMDGFGGDHVDDTRTGGRPSVAVLPFANRGGEDYFAAATAENIVAGLTRFRDLFVISGGSSFALEGGDLDPVQAGKRLGVAHVLEGSVLRSGDRLRVTVQLVDVRTGRHLWAEKYDREADDLLTVQDDITANIVASLVGHVEDASRLRSESKPPENMLAYDYLLRARHCLGATGHGGFHDVLEARELFGKALDLEPGLAAAWAGLAVSYVTEYESEWSPQGRLEALPRAEDFANRAVALDDACAYGHWTLACTHFYGRRPGLAEHHIDRAIALNPNEYRNHCVKAWMLVFRGETADGIACAMEGQKINPIASSGCHINIGIGEYTAGNYRASVNTMLQALKLANMRDMFLAASYAQLGEMQDAGPLAADLVQRYTPLTEPYGLSERDRWTGYVESLFPYQKSADMEHFVEGLRKAGLPL